MGLFDSVYAACPRCGKDVEFQSKAGECHMNTYRNESVPSVIAADIDGQTAPCSCGAIVRIGNGEQPRTISMPVSVT